MVISKRAVLAAIAVLVFGVPAPNRAQDAMAVKKPPFNTPAVSRPETYGTAEASFYNVDAYEMVPDSSDVTYGTIGGRLRYQSNDVGYAPGFALQSALHLPAGALITYIELDYYDNSAFGQVRVSLGVCDHAGMDCVAQFGTCDGTATVCSDVAAAPGYGSAVADLTAAGLQVDNLNYRYVLYTGNTTTDGSTAISKVIVGYKLQVSPAPAIATFNDVPTSHPFFQYVEALAASGITAGCQANPPLYCPDASLTRGQMAVFLSKALGLFFPN
jgi:hypothetical protein